MTGRPHAAALRVIAESKRAEPVVTAIEPGIRALDQRWMKETISSGRCAIQL